MSIALKYFAPAAKTLLWASIFFVAGCGGDTSSGAGARFLETPIVFKNIESDIQCENVIVEKGALAAGGNFAQCTWPCGIGGPRNLDREFYRRRWTRPNSTSAYRFETDEVQAGICL